MTTLRTPTAFPYLVLGGLSLLGALFALNGWRARVAQALRVVPVTATVRESSLHSNPGTGRVTLAQCEGDITFDYEVAGRRFTGRRLNNALFGNSCEEVRELLDQAPEGATITAYHDPRYPGRSFAFGDPSLLGYLVAPLLVLFPFWLAERATRNRTVAAPKGRTEMIGRGWYPLKEVASRSFKMRLAAAAAAVWIALLGLGWWVADVGALGTPLQFANPELLAISISITLALVVVVANRAVLARAYPSPTVAVDQYPLPLGGFVAIRVAQPIGRRMQRVHGMQVAVACRMQEPWSKRPPVIIQEYDATSFGMEAVEGSVLEHEFRVLVPPGELPTPDGRVRWSVWVDVDGPGLVNQRLEFPVAVDYVRDRAEYSLRNADDDEARGPRLS